MQPEKNRRVIGIERIARDRVPEKKTKRDEKK